MTGKMHPGKGPIFGMCTGSLFDFYFETGKGIMALAATEQMAP